MLVFSYYFSFSPVQLYQAKSANCVVKQHSTLTMQPLRNIDLHYDCVATFLPEGVVKGLWNIA